MYSFILNFDYFNIPLHRPTLPLLLLPNIVNILLILLYIIKPITNTNYLYIFSVKDDDALQRKGIFNNINIAPLPPLLLPLLLVNTNTNTNYYY